MEKKGRFFTAVVVLACALILGVVVSVVRAQTVPKMISFQGRLTDGAGLAVGGTVNMTFSIYDVQSGGTYLWSEPQAVSVQGGIYQVQLGAVNPLPASLFATSSLYLEVAVGAETLSPRYKLTSTPFAMNAALLDGQSAAEFSPVGHTHGQYLTLSGGTVSGALQLNGAVTATGGFNAPGAVDSSDLADGTITGADVANDAFNATQIQDIYVFNSGDDMTGPLSATGNPWSVKGIGISGPTNGYLGVQGLNDFDGVAAADWPGWEIGVAGISTDASPSDNYGLLGLSTGVGVRGEFWNGAAVTNYGHLGTGTAGVYGYSPNGDGVFGSSTAIGVHGQSTQYYAGYFESSYASSSTRAVFAEMTAVGNYDGTAVYGGATPADGYGYGGRFYGGYVGVFAQASGGAYNGNIYGLRATATRFSGAGANYGVYTTTSGGNVNFAVYAVGDVYTTGAYLPSDARLKTDFRVPAHALDKVMKLKPQTYSYKPEMAKRMALPTAPQTGLVAQEVEQIFPELVKEAVQPADDKNDPTGDFHFKALNYTGLIPHLVQAIQEQQQTIASQQAAIDDLTRRLAALEKDRQGRAP